ncbi:MAG: YbbR-like domain-containing protein [Wujia sp.]
MKNKILNNFALKILSVICAVLLWLIVMNISDYAVTIHVDDIPVTQLNGDVLEELEHIYEVSSGDTVDIIVKGRRSVVSRLSADDFIATADLSKMSITNTVLITVVPKDASIQDDITITYVDNTMTLSLEDKISVQLPVIVNVKGIVADGYAVGETYTSPNIITVEGPASTVSKITEAVVEVNVDNRTNSFETNDVITLYDAYDEPIESDKITISDTNVKVGVNVYPVKSVKVDISVEGEPAEGYVVVGDVQYQPQTVFIAGPEDKIKDVNKIVIEDISMDGLKNNLQTSINISDYLPMGTILAQNNSEIVITVVIEKLVTKSIKPEVEDLTILNRDSRYKYTIEASDDFEIIITGLNEDIQEIDIDALQPTIDCSNMVLGTYKSVTPELNDIENIEYEIKGSVSVKITK